MPFCPQCGVENPDSARFCDQCGATLIAVPASAPPPPRPIGMAPTVQSAPIAAGPGACPQCGTAVIPGEAFCDNCGASLLGATTPAASGTVAPTPPYSAVPPQASYPSPQPVTLVPTASPVSPQSVAPTASPAMPPITPPPVVQAVVPQRTLLAPAQLIVQSSQAVLALPSANQALLGRADPVSNFFPDIDLTPHGALDTGVGRRHARLFVQNGQIYVEDLDSTNGTFLNQQKLAPRTPQLLRTGDELRLGALVLRVQF